MGRSGDLLRQQKAEKVLYHYTRAQMEEHDKMVRQQVRDRCKKEMDAYYLEREKQFKDAMQKQWDEMCAIFHTGDQADDFYNLLQHLLSVSCRVLIEKFNWRPYPRSNNRKTNINMFMEYITDEINAISSDDTKDIRIYNDETFKKYGIRFDRVEE